MKKVITGDHPQMSRTDVLPDGKEMGRDTAGSQDTGYKGYQRKDTCDGPGEAKSRKEQSF